MRTHSLFGRAEQVERLQPNVERNVRTLEHGADGDTELLAAAVLAALPKAGTMRLAFELPMLANGAAMRADRLFGPAQGFEIFPSLISVLKVWLVQRVHGLSPLWPLLYQIKPGLSN